MDGTEIAHKQLEKRGGSRSGKQRNSIDIETKEDFHETWIDTRASASRYSS
jgi:hypothetical protein